MYRVTWEIDLDAPTPEEAARKAYDVLQDPESLATVFDVYEVRIMRGREKLGAVNEVDVLDLMDGNGNWLERDGPARRSPMVEREETARKRQTGTLSASNEDSQH